MEHILGSWITVTALGTINKILITSKKAAGSASYPNFGKGLSGSLPIIWKQ